MTTMRISQCLRPGLAVAGLAALGLSCGGPPEGQVPVHPARGRVLYKGKPLADALVVLRPVAPPSGGGKGEDVPQPTGRTDAEGAFQLHTYLGNDGAPAGSYLVGISVAPAFSETRDLLKNALAKTPPKAGARRAPDGPGTRYVDPAKSGLKAEIQPSENEIPPFDLR